MTNRESTLSSKVAVITGGSAGVGLATARELIEQGWRVVIGCRNTGKGTAALATIAASFPLSPKPEALQLDLADPASVDSFATAVLERAPALHLLILNAAHVGDATAGSPAPELTPSGHEKTFATNHLGHYVLTYKLLPALLAAGNARVVAVSAQGHKWTHLNKTDLELLGPDANYNPLNAYIHTKLMNVLFAKALDARLRSSGVTAVSVHPGIIPDTELVRNFGGWFWTLLGPAMVLLARAGAWWRIGTMCSVQVAAQGVVKAAEAVEAPPGAYFEVGVQVPPGEDARGEVGDGNADWLWKETARIAGIDQDWGLGTSWQK